MTEHDDDDLTRALTRLGEWRPSAEASRAVVKRTRVLIDRATPLNPLGAVWRRKGFLIGGVLAGLALGFLYYINRTPIYESTTTLVVKQDAHVAGVVETHIVTIQSLIIIDRAIDKAKLDKLKTFTQDPARSTIQANLVVSRAAATPELIANRFIVMRYRGPISEDCQTILVGIHDAYQEFLADRRRERREVDETPLEILSPPELGVKVGPFASRVLTIGLAFGLLLGVFFAYLVEVADRALSNQPQWGDRQ